MPDKDTEKSVVYIDETTEGLENFIRKISEFNSKKDKLQNELKNATVSDLESKQSELAKKTDDKNTLESKIHNLKNEISESKTKIPSLIMDIEEKLREISSTKYTIDK